MIMNQTNSSSTMPEMLKFKQVDSDHWDIQAVGTIAVGGSICDPVAREDRASWHHHPTPLCCLSHHPLQNTASEELVSWRNFPQIKKFRLQTWVGDHVLEIDFVCRPEINVFWMNCWTNYHSPAQGITVVFCYMWILLSNTTSEHS